jgi:23S rRNA (guanine2445-N2)-methyltransferase / 23S rRNA (guanine2069-N7)-methyltransferase
MAHFALHAKTLTGLEPVLAAELTELGAEEVRLGHRLVTFVGDQRLLYRTNVCCRTAIRILQPLATFAADSERALYDGVRQIDWAKHLDADASLTVDPVVWSSFSTHSLYVAQLTKDAIVDQFRDRTGRRPSVDRDAPDLRVNVHLVENVATVYLDASGDSLHLRGYRRQTGEAPLNEVLAAGILRLAEWDRQSPLVDPMCGSGTLCIEAAMAARNIAPGTIRRGYAFQRWKDYDAELYKSVMADARSGELPALAFPIVGSDIDDQVVRLAEENARRAGVGGEVAFAAGNFECFQPPAAAGTLVMNPPYDERMPVPRIEVFYRRIGDTLKQRFAGYTAWLLTGNLDAAKQIGLRPSRKLRLFNGSLECRLLRFDLYQGTRRRGDVGRISNPSKNTLETPIASSPAAPQQPGCLTGEPTEHPSATGISAKWIAQAEMFRNRLTRMAKHWRKWARRQGITCYRVYERDVPEVPLIIDWYEGHLHVAEYVRPHDRSAAEHQVWLDYMVAAAAETLGVAPPYRVFFKRRQRQLGKSQYARQQGSGGLIEVHEGGHRFLVNLSDYLDTGLFLDHRQTRAMVKAEAAGKRFLNLFGYTGAFTVYAAAAGARGTTTVDLSQTYLDWARRNLQLNGLTGEQHQLVRDDALAFLRRRAGRREPPFELAVVDPPTFSNSKRLTDVWDVQQHHAELLNAVLRQMVVGGKVYFSTNLRRFKLHEEAIVHATIREITKQTIPPDFRNKRIHHSWMLVRTA